ncbi:hypothetical protein HDU93_007733 [Gonapodya sp. JEL0774]|nr:hypothetical protein HDU93_007733 [Gonapodya sp. JEL0774]
MQLLPEELLLQIFMFLPPATVYSTVARGCKRFRIIVCSQFHDDADRIPVAVSLTIRQGGRHGESFEEPGQRAQTTGVQYLPRFTKAKLHWLAAHAEVSLLLTVFNVLDRDEIDTLIVRITIPPFTLSKLRTASFQRACSYISRSLPVRLDLSADFSSRWAEVKPDPCQSVRTLGTSGFLPPVLDGIGGVSYVDLVSFFPSTDFLDLSGSWGDFRYFRRVMGALKDAGKDARIARVRINDNNSTPPFKPYILSQFFSNLKDFGNIPLTSSLSGVLSHSSRLLSHPRPTVEVLRFYVELSTVVAREAVRAAAILHSAFPSVRLMILQLEAQDHQKFDDISWLVDRWIYVLDAFHPIDEVRLVEAGEWGLEVLTFVQRLKEKVQQRTLNANHLVKVVTVRVGEREDDYTPWTAARGVP